MWWGDGRKEWGEIWKLGEFKCCQLTCHQMTWCEPIFLLEDLSWNFCQDILWTYRNKMTHVVLFTPWWFFLVLAVVYIECFMWNVTVFFLIYCVAFCCIYMIRNTSLWLWWLFLFFSSWCIGSWTWWWVYFVCFLQ